MLRHLILLCAALSTLAAPAFAQSVGCATPSSMAHYFAPQFQSCAGTSVAVSETTLYARWNANTSHSLSCGSQTGGMLRYNNGNLELCNGTSWGTLASSASPQDRIVSGTSSVFVAGGGAVSVTVAGSNVANFGSGGLGITNINASGAISATGTGYFGGNVGIGTTSPGSIFEISSTNAIIRLTDGSTSTLQGSSGNMYYSTASTSRNHYFRGGSTNLMYIGGNGMIGIGNATPGATLQISGSLIVSTTGQNTSPSLYIGTNGQVGLATPNPSSTLHIYDTGDITTGSYAGITIGANTGSNLGIDNNEIVTKSNGSASTLYINNDGGAVIVAGLDTTPEVGIGKTVTTGVSLEVSGTVSATNVYSAGVMKMGKYAAQPVACSSTYDGMLALTSARRMCICDATSWKEINSATACTW